MTEETENPFQIKTIRWSEYQFLTPILLQDANGPCPLIALVNTLLLQYEFELQTNPNNPCLVDISQFRKSLLHQGKSIALEHLLTLIGNLMAELIETSTTIDHNCSTQLLNLLPHLHTGLDVNPNLITGDFCKDDLATILFTNVFQLEFHHAWILDTHIPPIEQLQYFDKIQDSIISNGNDMFTDTVTQWLENTKSQITDIGIDHLKNRLNQNQFTIFFRNNHFNTLLKGPDDNLYILVTDSSFAEKTVLIWQSLSSSSGKDDIFYTGNYFPVLNEDIEDIEDFQSQPDTDENMDLLKQLQLEQDEKMANELQSKYMRTTHKSKHKSRNNGKTLSQKIDQVYQKDGSHMNKENKTDKTDKINKSDKTDKKLDKQNKNKKKSTCMIT